MANVLIPLAEGFEELEAVTIIDLLRRAGINVTVAGLHEGSVTGSRGTVIIPDDTLDMAMGDEYDMMVLPGGLPGADNLNEDTRINSLLRQMEANDRYTAAICAAPKVLASAGLLNNKTVTAYPGTLETLDVEGMHYDGGAVVQDGKVVTSRGPGTAMDFALSLIGLLEGDSIRDQVEKGLVR
ncbi:MAG TPA: DJ-1 family protein [Gammaproteobacteria bacterium]|nr:DJ-1 family protein [Gammaproteobacteria bacterium]